MDKTYAHVTWSVEDIATLRPEWSDEKAMSFLVDNEQYIQEAMVQAGWDAIESLLPEWGG